MEIFLFLHMCIFELKWFSNLILIQQGFCFFWSWTFQEICCLLLVLAVLLMLCWVWLGSILSTFKRNHKMPRDFFFHYHQSATKQIYQFLFVWFFFVFHCVFINCLCKIILAVNVAFRFTVEVVYHISHFNYSSSVPTSQGFAVRNLSPINLLQNVNHLV